MAAREAVRLYGLACKGLVSRTSRRTSRFNTWCNFLPSMEQAGFHRLRPKTPHDPSGLSIGLIHQVLAGAI